MKANYYTKHAQKRYNDLVVIYQAAKPREMLVVDDFAVILIFKRFIAVLPFDLRGHGVHKRVLDGFFIKNVVWSHTGLTAVKILSEHDALCRQFDIGAGVYDAGAFPSKLQNSGSQVLRRVAKHLFAHRLAARKENEIKFLIEERGILRSAAGDHRHIFGGEAFLLDHLYSI